MVLERPRKSHSSESLQGCLRWFLVARVPQSSLSWCKAGTGRKPRMLERSRCSACLPGEPMECATADSEDQPLLSWGTRGGRPLTRLTLHPECEELLRGARRVVGHTHVAGSVSHFCRGNLGVHVASLMALGPPGTARAPSHPAQARQTPCGAPSEDHLCLHGAMLREVTPRPARAVCDIGGCGADR